MIELDEFLSGTINRNGDVLPIDQSPPAGHRLSNHSRFYINVMK
jgi:hypothetical protein